MMEKQAGRMEDEFDKLVGELEQLTEWAEDLQPVKIEPKEADASEIFTICGSQPGNLSCPKVMHHVMFSLMRRAKLTIGWNHVENGQCLS